MTPNKADVVERPRLVVVEAVAGLDDAPLARCERFQGHRQRLLAHGGLDGLVGERLVPVLDEVAECWRVVVVEWLVERDRRLGGLEDALHLIGTRSRSWAISSTLGLRPSSARSLCSARVMPFSFSTMWTGMRIVRDLSARARAAAWRIHQVAYVENLKPLR